MDEDLLYLKDLRQDWWKSGDTVRTVALVLNKFGVFRDTGQVIDYFQSPRKYQYEIDSLVESLK